MKYSEVQQRLANNLNQEAFQLAQKSPYQAKSVTDGELSDAFKRVSAQFNLDLKAFHRQRAAWVVPISGVLILLSITLMVVVPPAVPLWFLLFGITLWFTGKLTSSPGKKGIERELSYAQKYLLDTFKFHFEVVNSRVEAEKEQTRQQRAREHSAWLQKREQAEEAVRRSREHTVALVTDGLREFGLTSLDSGSLLEFQMALVEVITSEWLERGGRELPQVIRWYARDVLKTLCNSCDIESGDFDLFDGDGLPFRPSIETVLDAYLEITTSKITENVQNRLSLNSKYWPPTLNDTMTRKVFQIATKQIALTEARQSSQINAAQSLAEYQMSSSHPLAQPYGVTPRGAELWVRDWMIHMGARDAEATQASNDGGIDVVAAGWVAQVKLYKGTASISEIRELAGSALVIPGKPSTLFFCSGGYPASASDYATSVGMALFEFSVESGKVFARNYIAEQLLVTGLLATYEYK